MGFSSDSYAQNRNRPRGINTIQQIQKQHIIRGVKSGELTRNEFARLRNEQRQIARLEARFRNSGDGLSERERNRLKQELREANRPIYQQIHDDQQQPEP